MKNIITPILVVGVLAACSQPQAPDLYEHYIEDGKAHPVVILLGGSDGGNYFASPEMRGLLDRYHNYGFSVVSLGYFATEGTTNRPVALSLNDINARIKEIASDPSVAENCVALLGFSKGAELALLLGSYFDTANHIVAAYPSHVAWNALKSPRSQPGWRLDDKNLPYINAPLLSFDMLSGVFTGEYSHAFTNALSEASPQEIAEATIPVERISGSITLISGKEDQIWPSYHMALSIEERLTKKNYKQPVMHIALDGDHYSYNNQTMDVVLTHLKKAMGPSCN